MQTGRSSHVNHTATPGSLSVLLTSASGLTLLDKTGSLIVLPESLANRSNESFTLRNALSKSVRKLPPSRILLRGMPCGHVNGWVGIFMFIGCHRLDSLMRDPARSRSLIHASISDSSQPTAVDEPISDTGFGNLPWLIARYIDGLDRPVFA